MRIKKIKGFETELPKKGAFTIETDDDYPKLHTLCVASGKRGGGKSVAIANFIKKCKDKGYYDRVWLITPTYASNAAIWDIAEIDKDDVFEPEMGTIDKIKELVVQEKEEWEDFKQRKKLLQKYKTDIDTKPLHQMGGNDLLNYLEAGFFDNLTLKWKYKVEQPPRLAVIIDDCLGTDLMARRTAGLTNLCIRHRHIGDGLGISVFMLVQSYCALGGVPRAVRENTTHLMLFKINDEKQIAKVKEESDLPITDDEWLTMCDYAHSKPYNFLFLDFCPKDPSRRFRSGFDEYIIPDSQKEPEPTLTEDLK
tara:strand:+ start:579 stop:1505 length:927 start_codon:yes stop_codon:yes gene_type:complete